MLLRYCSKRARRAEEDFGTASEGQWLSSFSAFDVTVLLFGKF